MTTGQHLIKGKWTHGDSTSVSKPCHGQGFTIHNASSELVNQAVSAATQSFQTFAHADSADRAQLLRTIADEINLRGDDITEICAQETGLPAARLTGERGRTTQQLNMFADYIEAGSYLQISIDQALPERSPLPRPELRKMMRPYGPVAVFGASNFPLAFSTAGGDTASALAAGCPVVVKGHPAHPATSEIIAQAVLAAIKKCHMDPGIFSLLQDSGFQAAQDLVAHPDIRAVGFTGSLQGGRALFDLCNQRPVPIPFYGEMGSLNPVFVLPAALTNNTHEIARGWVGSLTLGTGQFCTKPGLLILPQGAEGDEFIQTAQQELTQVDSNSMLTKGIANAYIKGVHDIQNIHGVNSVFSSESKPNAIKPNVISTSAKNWLEKPSLHDEIFGPFAIIIRTNNSQEMLAVAQQLAGQLSATVFIDSHDLELGRSLLPVLEQKAGRVLANGYPTGVEVAESMVHGGPYPASTFVGTTSVGTTAIQRFLRPVCYQNLPVELLPKELRSDL